ncbi:DUF3800 domain-containing protein [Bradyrhizobium sp. LjRoot220]|uniref:DUF3800 domain-containing protein n=1 Tax=Bradyrhizobium sp. LjRoot220 TaxID=3342284 RepID=UPI003ED03DBF
MNAYYRGDAFTIIRRASGLRRSRGRRLILVFECYLDDSGTSGLPIVTMAGFLAPIEAWEELEPKWDSILSSFNVDVFHSKEFYSTKPPFKTWTRVKKLSFADELFSASHGRIFGASVSVSVDEIARLKKIDPGYSDMSPMGVAFSSILMKLVTDEQFGPSAKERGISFLVETGNRNNAEIDQYFHKMAVLPVFEGCLRSISFIPKRHCRAIQMADFYAFFSRRQSHRHYRFGGKLIMPPCPYIEIVKRHGPIWQKVGTFNTTRGINLNAKDFPDLDSFRAALKEAMPQS